VPRLVRDILIAFWVFEKDGEGRKNISLKDMSREELNRVIDDYDIAIEAARKKGATEVEIEELKQKKIDALVEKREKSREERQQTSLERMNDAIADSLASLSTKTISGLAEGLGNVMSGLQDPFNAMRTLVADFLIDIGKALIATAILSEAFRDLIKLGPEGVIPAIVAGIAAVAIGTYLKSRIAQGVGGISKPMADGGLLYGPTNILAGEYAGARDNPEVVGKLSTLKDMIQPDRGSERLIAVVKGRDIAFILKRENDFQSRV